MKTWLPAFSYLLATLLLASDVRAQSDEAVFWQSIANSSDSAEFCAYLEAFPNGKFAALAKLRAKKLGATCGDVASSKVSPAPKTATKVDWQTFNLTMDMFPDSVWSGTDSDCAVSLSFEPFINGAIFTWSRECGDEMVIETNPYGLSPGMPWLNLPEQAMLADLCRLSGNAQGQVKLSGCKYEGIYSNAEKAPLIRAAITRHKEQEQQRLAFKREPHEQMMFIDEAEGANALAEPTKSSDSVIVLPGGTAVDVRAKVKSEGDEYYEVKLRDGDTAYIRSFEASDERPLFIAGTQWTMNTENCAVVLTFGTGRHGDGKFEWRQNCSGDDYDQTQCQSYDTVSNSHIEMPYGDWRDRCAVTMSEDGQTMTLGEPCRYRATFNFSQQLDEAVVCDNPFNVEEQRYGWAGDPLAHQGPPPSNQDESNGDDDWGGWEDLY